MAVTNSVAVARKLSAAVTGGEGLDGALDEVLEATGARATGLWKVVGSELHQLGFRGCLDMPADVKRDFAAATFRVPLDRIGLGIVKAVVDRAPALSERQSGNQDLQSSPGWLERFACRRSLATPILEGDQVLGVLAISTTEAITPGDPVAQFLNEIADGLQSCLRE